jgi:hypothetical protein
MQSARNNEKELGKVDRFPLKVSTLRLFGNHSLRTLAIPEGESIIRADLPSAEIQTATLFTESIGRR